MPKIAQASPHRLSQKRARRALRAVVGSLPVRITAHHFSLQRTLLRGVHQRDHRRPAPLTEDLRHRGSLGRVNRAGPGNGGADAVRCTERGRPEDRPVAPPGRDLVRPAPEEQAGRR
nr:hypothetical protein StreXyl84_48340 [Streptomyces sp. Xyl84]